MNLPLEKVSKIPRGTLTKMLTLHYCGEAKFNLVRDQQRKREGECKQSRGSVDILCVYYIFCSHYICCITTYIFIVYRALGRIILK